MHGRDRSELTLVSRAERRRCARRQDRLPIAQREEKRGSLSVFALEAQLGPLVSGQPVRRRGGTRARSPAGSP
jgi:hypothetical protein